MHKLLLLGVAMTAIVAVTTPSLSMGGGGGGGGGGGYGGGMGEATFDDYAVAVRMIKHEKYADAIPHLLVALSNRPHSADILNYLGYTNRMTGQYSTSLDYYKRALTYDPDHKGAHEYLGELYLQMNDLASARHELDTLASLCPSGCDERDTLDKAITAYAPPSAAPQAAPVPSGG